MKKKVWNGRMNHRKFVIFALESMIFNSIYSAVSVVRLAQIEARLLESEMKC